MEKRLFGLIGRKLGHSFSQTYFGEKFTQLGIAATYELFELETIAQLPHLLKKQPHLEGFNVTIPYKTAVISHLSALSTEAADIGAVNTVRIRNGILTGFNTDAYGFRVSLERLLGAAQPSKALVLGTGGAARAVTYVLHQLAIPFEQVSRTRTLAALAYTDLTAASVQAYDLIVNTTPVGMYPDVEGLPPLPTDGFREGQYVYDLIYNPAQTRLMAAAAARGALVRNGLEMLHLQAEKAWEIWDQGEDG